MGEEMPKGFCTGPALNWGNGDVEADTKVY